MEDFFHSFINHYQGSYTRQVLDEAFALFGNLWPYLLAGILLTTCIKLYLSKAWITSYFQKNPNTSVFFGSVLGIAAPLGSYVVIPLSASLFSLGVPLPVVMALMVSSPLIDPTLFILTAGAFGFQFATARLVTAFLLGIIAGYGTQFLLRTRFTGNIEILSQNGRTMAESIHSKDAAVNLRNFGAELYRMTMFISRYFFLAILLAALIKILTPPEFLMHMFGQNSFLSVVISTGAGIPFYVCGGAAIPVIQQLADLGMSHGAALAFFISGPITKISNLVLMRAAFSFRVFLLYLIVGIAGALFFGLIYNLLF